MKLTRILAGLVLALACSCGLFRSLRPGTAGQTIVIVYAGDLNWNRLPEFSALVKSERADLALIAGELVAGWPVSYLFQGRAEGEALAASGVSAVCIAPEMLQYGVRQARAIIDSFAPNVMFLAANVMDSAHQSPLGQGFMKARVATPGPVERLGLLALTADSTSPYVRQPGILWQNPQKAARRFLPALRLGTDLVGVVLSDRADLELPGADFVIGSRTAHAPLPRQPDVACRLELKVDSRRRVVSHRVREIKLGTIEPDPGLKAIVDRYQHTADSSGSARINDSEVELSDRVLTRIMARVAPMLTRANGALFGNSLRLKPLPSGPVTLQGLHECAGANRLVMVRVKGAEVGSVALPGEPGIQWRGALRRQPIPLAREYDIVTTLDYVRTLRQLQDRPLEFLPVTAAQVLAQALRDRTRDSTPEE